jgi:FixJ family two-component response regulator/DNA-binding MarR family transcriptional regulator
MGTPDNRSTIQEGVSKEAIGLHILLIDDDAALLEEQADLLDVLGYSCTTAATPEAAETAFAADPNINVIIADWSLPGENGLSLIDHMRTTIGANRAFVAILQTGHPSVDLAVESMHSGLADFICKPATAEILETALDRARRKLAEMSSFAADDKVFASVQAIQDSLNALMKKVGVEPAPNEEATTKSGEPSQERTITSGDVKAIMKARRQRGKYFENDLFSDPSWDILLELTAAHLEGRQESVTSVALATSVPTSTAMRRIREMTDKNLLHRWDDPSDARRIFVALTKDTADRMVKMLSNMDNPPII